MSMISAVMSRRSFGVLGQALTGQFVANRMFSGALPDTDEKKAFYTLGVNGKLY